MFPVPASAAICAFKMTTSDGRTVTGVAKERESAREEYEQALRAGQFTGLVNYVTDDSWYLHSICRPWLIIISEVFTISIGEVHLEVCLRFTFQPLNIN
jgi:hypothetical protein